MTTGVIPFPTQKLLACGATTPKAAGATFPLVNPGLNWRNFMVRRESFGFDEPVATMKTNASTPSLGDLLVGITSSLISGWISQSNSLIGSWDHCGFSRADGLTFSSRLRPQTS